MPESVPVDSSDGVTIASYRLPAGTDASNEVPTMLFAHANGFCAGAFAPLVGELGGTQVVAYDARAHGRSTAGDRMVWEAHRDDLLAVHDAWGLDQPVGVGHSMGGAALLLAEQLRPGTFSALWLFEPIVFPPGAAPPDAESPLETSALRRRRTFDSKAAAYANFAAKRPLEDLRSDALAAYVEYGFETLPDGTATLACSPEHEAAGFRMGSRHAAWDSLGEVGCPVMVVRGREEALPGPATMAPAIVERLPQGTLEDHPEMGHFGPLQDPAACAASITAFSESAANPVDTPG